MFIDDTIKKDPRLTKGLITFVSIIKIYTINHNYISKNFF